MTIRGVAIFNLNVFSAFNALARLNTYNVCRKRVGGGGWQGREGRERWARGCEKTREKEKERAREGERNMQKCGKKENKRKEGRGKNKRKEGREEERRQEVPGLGHITCRIGQKN